MSPCPTCGRDWDEHPRLSMNGQLHAPICPDRVKEVEYRMSRMDELFDYELLPPPKERHDTGRAHEG